MRRAFLLLFLLVLCGRALAAEAWVASVLGPYEGPVLSSGRIQHLSSNFWLDGEGHLLGHYHVEDAPSYDGDLTDFRPDGDRQGNFIWHDRYGEGVVHIRFDPDHGRFTGRWGDDFPVPDNVFDGFRVRPPAVS